MQRVEQQGGLDMWGQPNSHFAGSIIRSAVGVIATISS